MLSRRRFIGLGAGAAGGALAARLAWGAMVDDRIDDAARAPGTTSASTGPASDARPRVLVVIQLSGGNDGLNTVVPAHDGRYFDARPTLQVAENDVVALPGQDRYGLHPALAPLVALWGAGRLAAVEAIGFPDQSRSHFAAMDTWWRATTDRSTRSGWLGRWLDGTDGADDPLQAIALGGGSPALVGDRAASTVVLDPKAFTLRTPKGADADAIKAAFRATAEPLVLDPDLAAAQRAVPSTLDAVEALARAASPAADPATSDEPTGPEGKVRSLLGTAAGIIDLDLGTRVIVVAGDGFDTHTDQHDRQAALLTDVASGIVTFMDTVDSQGRGDQVMVMTTSEFGRHVRENGTGTDHGTASVHLLVGAGLARAQIVGDADLGDLVDGDLRATIDSRSLYAAALDWLGADPGATDAVLGSAYDRHGLVA